MDKALNHLLEFGEFRLDPHQRLLLRDNHPVPLSPKAFDLLLTLVQRSGQLVSKDELMQALWPDTFVEESNLGQQVFQIRKALGEKAQGSSYIVTVPGRGYRFAQTVRLLPAEDDNIIVASRSRTRVLVEESSSGLDRVADLRALSGSALSALPGQTRAPGLGWRWIFVFLSLGIAAGALAVWIFFRPLPMPKAVRSVQLTHFGRVEPYSRALSDGSRIFFTQRVGGTWALTESEPGGEPKLLSTSVGDAFLDDIDRRRSRLLVVSEGPREDDANPLWEISTAGGSGRRVGTILASDAAWSPDGQSIAYSKGNSLFVSADDGSHATKIFSTAGVVQYPAWSPDGKKLSFSVRELSGIFALWESSPDGHDAHPLSFGWKALVPRFGEGECCGNWSPDGKYFVFHALREGIGSLWLIREGRRWFGKPGMPVQIYTNPDRLNDPRFSADGRSILFVNAHDRRELLRYDSSKKAFEPFLGGIAARHVSFSRDGQWVAYKNQLDNTLWRSRADGSQALQLTFPPLDTYHPTWSPDGQQIAFEGNGKLYIVPFAGGNPEPLFAEGMIGGQPSWSPDGKNILFTLWGYSQPGRLALLEVATHKIQIIPGSDDFEGAQWSPDGKYAAASDRRGQRLMLFDFHRQTWSELCPGLPYGWGIRWSSDSRFVYYQHIYEGLEQPIYRVRINDRQVEQITSAKDIRRADALSYSMTGLSPDGSPLVSLVHSTSDVYALELEIP